jgi:hypothetical protein
VTTDRLLRFYPRRWRERYGEEFRELMGDGPLGIQQQFDVFMGAIDAHLAWSPSGNSTNVGNQEARVMAGLRSVCATRGARMTTRDGVIGASIYLGVTAVIAVAGIWLKRHDMRQHAEILLSLAFPFSMVLAMPVTFMKGQPLRAQATVMGTTLGILLLIGYLTLFID